MKLHTIYRIYCTVSKKCYVGVTSNKKDRQWQHFNALKKGKHHSIHLQDAYNAYGRRAFRFQVIETKLSREDAYEREIAWINFYDSYHDGYNSNCGGDGGLLTPCVWNGIQYSSISEAAEACGITHSAMSQRLTAGYSSDYDMGGNRSHKIEWNGKRYGSINKAAIELGVSRRTMWQRVQKGYVCDKDIPKQGEQVAIAVVWNGIQYDSISLAAKANHVHKVTMLERLKRGYTCDEDMVGQGNARAVQVTWNGIQYTTITEAALANGVHKTTMFERVKKGYTCDADLKR